MTTKVRDRDGHRSMSIDGGNRKSPESVFLAGPLGFCIEFDRDDFLEAIRREFSLVPLAVMELVA